MIPFASSGYQNILRFKISNNSLKVITLMVMIITEKGFRFKLAKERDSWGRRQEVPNMELPGVLSPLQSWKMLASNNSV